MPKFATYKGMAPGKLIMEFNDKLHINGRVYRTSDLSEIVGKTAMPANHANIVANTPNPWTLRLKRGYQAATRSASTLVNTPQVQLADFDAALCGNWSGVSTSGVWLDSTKFRQFAGNNVGGNTGNIVIDIDTETGVISNSEQTTVLGTSNANEYSVFLPAGSGGTLAMQRNAMTASGSSSTVESYPAGATGTTITTLLFGTRAAATGQVQFHYRINDHALRWYFLGVNTSNTAASSLAVLSVLKTTLAGTTINGTLGTPAGATAIGATGLGYANSVPSYASNSAVNELSSYILWRSSTNMEIHRVQISNTDSTPTVTNNLVTLDSNPMTLHGNTTAATCSSARIQLVTHTDGNKYLLIFGMEMLGATPNSATATMYVYKLTDKNTGQFVGSYAMASGPRGYLASDDTGMRFIIAYDDRYEFWAFGASGVLSKVDTIYIQRNNSAQYYESDSYGFDTAGRFWYITPDSQKPANYAELGLNFYSPPGQVNTISVTFDSDNYTYSGTPVNGNLSVSVKDINGAYVAALVNLSPTANITLQSSTVNTNTSGPVQVPFSVIAAGDVSVEAWT